MILKTILKGWAQMLPVLDKISTKARFAGGWSICREEIIRCKIFMPHVSGKSRFLLFGSFFREVSSKTTMAPKLAFRGHRILVARKGTEPRRPAAGRRRTPGAWSESVARRVKVATLEEISVMTRGWARER